MTRNTFMKALVLAMVVLMANVNANAQGRAMREMHFGNGNMRMERVADAPRHNDRHEVGRGYAGRAERHMDRHIDVHHHVAHAPHFDRHGYLPGWEGRVRFHNGRYGYLRGNDWYWYDTYYAPEYYYAHPVAHFHHHHLSREGRAVATAVAGAVIVGGILAALAD
ncbi:MAG: hypothetical protein KBT29_10930 [Prevotellaceae bacterium]|nr:hypothetical protein [Candidatus Minthosoma caballi]